MAAEEHDAAKQLELSIRRLKGRVRGENLCREIMSVAGSAKGGRVARVAVAALLVEGDFADAMKVFKTARGDVGGDVAAGLMAAAAKRRDLHASEYIWSTARKHYQPSEYKRLLPSLLSTYTRLSLSSKVPEVFYKTTRQGIVPDSHILNAVLNASSDRKQLNNCLALFEKSRIAPTDATRAILLWKYYTLDSRTRAERYFEMILSEHGGLPERVWGVLIRIRAEQKDIKGCLAALGKSGHLNSHSFTPVLNLLIDHIQGATGDAVHRKLLDYACELVLTHDALESYTAALLFKAYATITYPEPAHALWYALVNSGQRVAPSTALEYSAIDSKAAEAAKTYLQVRKSSHTQKTFSQSIGPFK